MDGRNSHLPHVIDAAAPKKKEVPLLAAAVNTTCEEIDVTALGDWIDAGLADLERRFASYTTKSSLKLSLRSGRC